MNDNDAAETDVCRDLVKKISSYNEALSFKLLGSGLVNSIQAKKVLIELNEKCVREPYSNFFKHKGFQKSSRA